LYQFVEIVRSIPNLTRLTHYQQEQIQALSTKNVPYRKIAELLEVDRGQVFRLQQKYKTEEPPKPIKPTSAEILTVTDTGIFRKLKGLPFFCFQDSCNGDKCFWHNFPVFRYGKQMRLLNYEHDIVSKFEQSPFHIIMKPVSAGITTLCLYWLVWMATCNDSWGDSVGIICGPNISLAV
jgi:hypothetical protein